MTSSLCIEGQREAQKRGQVVQSFFDGQVALVSGHIARPSNIWETEQVFEGLKLVIIEQGALQGKLPNSTTRHISGPCICAIWNRGHGHEAMQLFDECSPVTYTSIFLPASSMEQRLIGDYEPIRDQLGIDKSFGPNMTVWPLTKSIIALCKQVASCPFQRGPKNFFLSGKALEIAAHIFDGLETQSASLDKLSNQDIERLYQAKEILNANLSFHHSIKKLSIAVSMNEKKLQCGFKRIFGNTVSEYLKTKRLDTAHNLISVHGMSVSSAAYQVGYSPAHLSVAFMHRFGFSPKNLKS